MIYILRFIFLTVFSIGLIAAPAHAADEFKLNNPDVKKYEFARSYISALSYLKNIDTRWSKTPPKKIYVNDDFKIIKGSINYLAMDNADLRIAKNYVLPYLNAKNALIRKTADMVAVACDREIGINDTEKALWQKWGDLKVSRQATGPQERQFVREQERLALSRKEADKDIIQASIMLTKVLTSANNPPKGHQLAITAKQRAKLVEKLDSFGKDVLDWGLKPGQRTLEASIAVIREILEDSMWTCIDGT